MLPGVLYLLLRSLIPAEIDRKAGEHAAAAAGGGANNVQHDFESSNALYSFAIHPVFLTATFLVPELWFLLQMSNQIPDQGPHWMNYCTASVFIKTLVLRGYAFDNSTFPQISFQKKVSKPHLDEFWF